MPIKTLHITNAYHQMSGGIAAFYRALLDAANRRGRQMRLVVPAVEDAVEEVGDCGRIYHVRAPQSPFFDRRYRLLTPRAYLFGGALSQILRDENPDLVEICDKYSVNWLAGLLRRGWVPGARRPALVGMSCERMDDNVRAFLGDGKWGERWSKFYLGALYIPLFDYHIANSAYTADELREAMVARHERQIHVRPMGADVRDFAAAHRSDESRRRLLAKVEGGELTKLLLYAGRLSPEKNAPLLIETIERLAGDGDFRLVIAGSGPLEKWIENEARRRAPGRMRLLGHIRNRAELIELYTNCDAFVHPNPREPFGIAPLEAMAAGLPLVAPRSGGVLSYADETNAWLCEANSESFAVNIRAIFADPAVRKDKLARARWAASRRDWLDVAASFFELYDTMSAEFPSSRFARGLTLQPPQDLQREMAHEKL